MSRQLNALEKKIHSECASKSNKIISQKEVDALSSDPKARMDALNFLLKAGMIVALTDKNGTVSYRAVTKKELDVKKEISGDENLVLQAIQAAKNDGIWTKHLKSKTDLHQTIITRCLKSLEQKGLIKPIKSVKYPTRRLYILSHLEPSVEVTGGPWYTDHELDTEFIRMLLAACLRFISDRSFPKDESDAKPLFPISQAPTYPSATNVLSFLTKSRITETELGIDHVESLLDVLVYDGLIERLPAFGGISWSTAMADSDESDDNEDGDGTKKKKRKKTKAKEKAKEKKRKRRKDESDEESSEDERPKKKRKTKKAASDEDESSEDDEPKKKKKKKATSGSKKRKRDESESESASEEDEAGSSKRKKKRKHRQEASSSSSETEADETMEEEDAPRAARKSVEVRTGGAGNVYRAIRQEHVEPLQAWAQAPCAQCPQFEFCDPGGPVNPRGCEYYTQWLAAEEAAF
ncbi:hypothetical protein AURDEDRAFT_111548 [Auricularia subglabra TFB-10046 SS5]|nr:hypothetical protein AURDEDRAFT_111548 [Auricularia subglabra TFB-10046 SS5]